MGPLVGTLVVERLPRMLIEPMLAEVIVGPNPIAEIVATEPEARFDGLTVVEGMTIAKLVEAISLGPGPDTVRETL